MYEALNRRREAAGLSDFQGHIGLHSKEFQQQRWIHADLEFSDVQITIMIDRWEAEPTVISLTDENDPEGLIRSAYLPLAWEIC